MTDRLYYHDPYLREFDATISRADRAGDRLEVVLDRTAFYPTSGGQPFDVGSLSDRPVVDVIDGDDDVIHVVADSPGADDQNWATGRQVRGTIDWTRRFDHMQQHTGQHILSAAFDRHWGARTVSFHLGTESCTIDLSRDLAPNDLALAEDEANRVVWEDRLVAVRFVSAEEAALLPLRKESTRPGVLRLIDIEGCDLSACGGTHVARTGAVGMIAIASAERFKGGLRVEFACGGRALARFRALREASASSVRLLSVLPKEVPAAIERLQADAKAQKRSISDLQTELAGHRAAGMAAEAEPTSIGRLVARIIEGDGDVLKTLALAIVAAPTHLVVLVSSTRPALVVVGRSADVELRSNEIVRDLIAKFGGRGGGRPELAQGGGLDGDPATILAEARRIAVSR